MATSCCQIEFLRQAVAELENDRTEQAAEFLQQLVAEIPWGHNLLILNKISEMDFYLNVLNEKERADDDSPSIGIILCAEKDNLEVEFALKSKTNPIGVAEYQLQSTLPEELKGKLPTSEQLREALGLS